MIDPELTYAEQLERIEKKLDMVIDFFNIHPDRIPGRSRKELREMARAKIYRLQNKQNSVTKTAHGNKKDR